MTQHHEALLVELSHTGLAQLFQPSGTLQSFDKPSRLETSNIRKKIWLNPITSISIPLEGLVGPFLGS